MTIKCANKIFDSFHISPIKIAKKKLKEIK